jgi:hypothetical protein
VSKLLGHSSLTTTTRYLNIQRRELRRGVTMLEERSAKPLQTGARLSPRKLGDGQTDDDDEQQRDGEPGKAEIGLEYSSEAG